MDSSRFVVTPISPEPYIHRVEARADVHDDRKREKPSDESGDGHKDHPPDADALVELSEDFLASHTDQLTVEAQMDTPVAIGEVVRVLNIEA